MKKFFGLLATLLVLALAIWIGRTLWVHYMETPWTRDGRVRADIINVAADVTGEVVDVPVRDNQLVKKGDLLMQIDPEHYRIAVKQAQSTWWRPAKPPGKSPGCSPPCRPRRPGDLQGKPRRRQQHRRLGLADYQHALAQLEAAELNEAHASGGGRRRLRHQPQCSSRRLRAHR